MPAEDVIFRAFWIIVARWKRRSQDWDRGQRPGSFRLPPGTGIIIYTGSSPWNGSRTISELVDAPSPLIDGSPEWGPGFLEVRQHAPEQLLKMDQRLFQSLAVVRGQNEPADVFGSIFADTFSRLASLRKQDQGRWIGLARFVMSWGLAKRRPAEHERLRSITRKVYRSQQAQQEIQQMMDTIIGAEFMKGVQQGLTQGEARGETRGRLAARREDLIGLLNGKFAEHVNESVVQRIEAASDLNVLKQWVEAAGISKSWKQFLKAVDWTPLP